MASTPRRASSSWPPPTAPRSWTRPCCARGGSTGTSWWTGRTSGGARPSCGCTRAAGHALVAESLPHADPVHRVSIIPRGIAGLGYTMQRPTEDRFLLTHTELLDRLAVLLGGRAAGGVVVG